MIIRSYEEDNYYTCHDDIILRATADITGKPNTKRLYKLLRAIPESNLALIYQMVDRDGNLSVLLKSNNYVFGEFCSDLREEIIFKDVCSVIINEWANAGGNKNISFHLHTPEHYDF